MQLTQVQGSIINNLCLYTYYKYNYIKIIAITLPGNNFKQKRLKNSKVIDQNLNFQNFQVL